MSTTSENKPANALKKCPKCSYERNAEKDVHVPDDTCPNCGIIYSKYKPQRLYPSTGRQDKKFQETAPNHFDKAASGIFDRIYSFIQEHIKSSLIILCIVALTSFFIGKTPLMSLLIETDDELVYMTQKIDCQTYGLVLYRILIGNTGENDNPLVTVRIENLPYIPNYVFYELRNLDASLPRASDPIVRVRCSDGEYDECPKVGTMMGLRACEQAILVRDTERRLSQHQFKITACVTYDPRMMQGVYSKEKHLEIFYTQLDDQRIFDIENFVSGAWLQLGIVCFEEDNGSVAAENLNQIQLAIETKGRLLEGDPQATSFAKLIQFMLDLF